MERRIGKYELQEFLGGGLSHVYRARDTVIGRTVAVKILTETGAADADTKSRFLAEARMIGNLQHETFSPFMTLVKTKRTALTW